MIITKPGAVLIGATISVAILAGAWGQGIGSGLSASGRDSVAIGHALTVGAP